MHTHTPAHTHTHDQYAILCRFVAVPRIFEPETVFTVLSGYNFDNTLIVTHNHVTQCEGIN